MSIESLDAAPFFFFLVQGRARSRGGQDDRGEHDKEDWAIGLASDDVTKLGNAWQRGKLVLNKVGAPYKSMLGKSLSLGDALYLFVERSERVLQLLHSLVRHISKDFGDWTSAGPFFGRSTISQHAYVWDAIFV